MRKKIVLSVFASAGMLFLGMQFDRPVRNNSDFQMNHISTFYGVPPDVNTILVTACYDCHSNNTRYPWYSEIQPIARMLEEHIVDGKKHLNFSEFMMYHPRRQFRKLEEIEGMVKADEMPLPSYTILHRDAVLSQKQKEMLYTWVRSVRDSMKHIHHPDSLLSLRKKVPS